MEITRKKCKYCGSEVPPSLPQANRKYCSAECKQSWWSDAVSKNVTRGEWAERRYGPLNRKNLPELDRVWLAAIWDGEGTIGVYRTKREKNKSGHRYVPVACVSNTNRAIIDRVLELVDGWASLREPRTPAANHKTIWTITIKGRSLRPFLEQIHPYLVGKIQQADLVLRCLDALDAAGMRTSTDHEIFEHFYWQCKALNKRGR